MIKKLTILLILIVFTETVFAQKTVGQWQDYLSYKNCFKVAKAGNKVYCASEGGLFYYDTSDNSIEKTNSLDGLSDFGIKTMAHHEALDVLVVAYNNSNIDLVFESRVVNIPDIKRKIITADKTISNILFIGNDAYLSCGFGIVILNLEKQEVKNTYYIGPDGGYLTIFDMEFDGQKLFAATESGVYYAEYNNPNLQDYNNWSRFTNIPNSTSKFSHLVIHQNELIACYTPDKWNEDKFYRFAGTSWVDYTNFFYAYDMQVVDNYLTVTSRNYIYIVDGGHNIVGRVNSYEFQEGTELAIDPKSACFSSSTGLWAADKNFGLVNVKDETYESMFPNGPISNKAFYLHENNNELFVVSGAIDGQWNNTWTQAGIMKLSNGQWSYYTKNEYPELEGKVDMSCIVTDPNGPVHFYAGSWGHGIFEFNNNQFVEHFDNQNSPLESAIPGNPDYFRVGGLAFDSHGTLWATNSEVANVLVSRSNDGEWNSYNLPEISNNKSIGQLIVTQNNDKWIIVPRGHNVYVTNDDVSKKIHQEVIAYFNNGEVELRKPMNDVFSIAEDKEGAIWLGTSAGVAVYSSPWRIWEPEFLYASRPSLELNDGLFHPLLENKTVTAIAVDGANRKWLGTKKSGVYLVSENGDTELLHFTEENSPLLSNIIMGISILPKTGEVFFATDNGIISYQGEATEGGNDFENVYAYPNPVRETYDGPITITGLVNNSDIKITDISGNLVYTTTSLGGRAVWDGKNLNGNRVKTGVYLIFCSDQAGEKTHISKLLFIN